MLIEEVINSFRIFL